MPPWKSSSPTAKHLCDKRLLGYDHSGRIRLLFHESGTNRPHIIALATDDFLKRWLTHVLPKGFVRVRHHGWMSGTARKTRPQDPPARPACSSARSSAASSTNPRPCFPRRPSRAARIAARR